jgi:hypothetical protein
VGSATTGRVAVSARNAGRRHQIQRPCQRAVNGSGCNGITTRASHLVPAEKGIAASGAPAGRAA